MQEFENLRGFRGILTTLDASVPSLGSTPLARTLSLFRFQIATLAHNTALQALAPKEDVEETSLSRTIRTLTSVLGERAPANPFPVITLRRGPNLTEQWIQKNWTHVAPGIETFLREHLTISSSIHVLQDHVQAFALKLIEKDTLAPYVARGEKINPSVLKIWAYQTACSEIRGWGVDASLRASRGAMTTRNREAMESGTVVMKDYGHTIKEVRKIKDNAELDPTVDYWDPVSRTAEDDLIYRETLREVEDMVRAKSSTQGRIFRDISPEALSNMDIPENLSNAGKQINGVLKTRIRRLAHE